LEAAHGAAEVFPDITKFLGSENQGNDDQDDQPVPDTEGAHIVLPLGGRCRTLVPGVGAPENMKMQMVDFLTAFPACIDDEAKATIMARSAPVVKSQLLRQYHHSTQPWCILGFDFSQRFHVFF